MKSCSSFSMRKALTQKPEWLWRKKKLVSLTPAALDRIRFLERQTGLNASVIVDALIRCLDDKNATAAAQWVTLEDAHALMAWRRKD